MRRRDGQRRRRAREETVKGLPDQVARNVVPNLRSLAPRNKVSKFQCPTIKECRRRKFLTSENFVYFFVRELDRTA